MAKTNNKKSNITNTKSVSNKKKVNHNSLMVQPSEDGYKKESKEPYKNHTCQGIKNKTEFMDFVKICKYTQKQLIKELPKRLLALGYENVIVEDGFIYAKGSIPILMTAHMDTVHIDPVKDFYDYETDDHDHIISSPQGIGGDDRCGIYMILEIAKNYHCSILFCEDEEIGGVGSNKFCKTKHIDDLKEMNYLLELDRSNSKDAVFYSCSNPDFTDFIEKETGYLESWGSFSDISHLSPACGIASVNLSCGYYNAHTVVEYVSMNEMNNTIDVVNKLLLAESKQYEYIEENYSRGYYCRNYGYDFDEEESSWFEKYRKNNPLNEKKYEAIEDINPKIILFVEYLDPDTGIEEEDFAYGKNGLEALANFFIEHSSVSMDYIIDYNYETENR